VISAHVLALSDETTDTVCESNEAVAVAVTVASAATTFNALASVASGLVAMGYEPSMGHLTGSSATR
jgi:branched-subunit amino acid transport protein